MKTKNYFFRYLLFLLCLLSPLSAWAFFGQVTEDGIIYDINTESKTAIVGGVVSKDIKTAKIKASVEGCPVTSINHYAFYRCSFLTTVEIPSTVTSIGERAFYDCRSLTSVEIPSSVTSIERFAFCGCSSLTSVIISPSVTSIENCTFCDCTSLTSVIIPPSVTSIGDEVFENCSSLTSIEIPPSVTAIDWFCFYNCRSLTSVIIPPSVTRIVENAFKGCSSLTSVYFLSDIANPRGFPDKSHITRLNLSDSAKELYDNYYRSKKIVDTHRKEYDALSDAKRQNFEETVNLSRLMSAFKGNDDDMKAYNDLVLKISDLLLDLLLEEDEYYYYNSLVSLYKSIPNNMDYNSAYSKHDGLIVDASQFSSNAQESSEGTYGGLIDNNRDTYFHSEKTSNKSNGAYHYLQIDLRDTYENIVLKYSIRVDRYSKEAGTPKTLHVYVTNTVDDESAWIDLGQYTCTYDFVHNDTGLLYLDFAEPYRYVRLVVEETMSNEVGQNASKPFFYWSELHAYPRYYANKKSALSEHELTDFNNAITTAQLDLDKFSGTEYSYWDLSEQLWNLDNSYKNKFQIADFSKSSYLTLYSDKALRMPEGMKAAVVVSNGNGISCDYRYEAGSVIPANTGVLIKGGKGNSFFFTEGETTEVSPADNLLHGTLSDETTNVEGDNKYYKLAYDNATGTQLGFYWGAEDGAPFLNKAGKAYLAVPVTTSLSQSKQGFSLNDLNNGVTTGLTAPTTTSGQPLRIYDLNGRRINAQSVNDLQPSIYVVNGKKMYVK